MKCHTSASPTHTDSCPNRAMSLVNESCHTMFCHWYALQSRVFTQFYFTLGVTTNLQHQSRCWATNVQSPRRLSTGGTSYASSYCHKPFDI
eukprot:5166919-Amphidinium_carterae.1